LTWDSSPDGYGSNRIEVEDARWLVPPEPDANAYSLEELITVLFMDYKGIRNH
jgi:hypothetical protein